MTAPRDHDGMNLAQSTPLATLRRAANRALVPILVAIPVLLVIAQALSWLRFGVDVPWLDDWRPYLQGKAGSLDLAYLFQPENQTLYPVGKILDAIVQRFIGGNVVAYQFGSMVAVLGALLLLQWKLLRLAIGSTLWVAAALLMTMPMLRADTFWGIAVNAYQQAIPLITVLVSIWLVLRTEHLRRSVLVIISVLAVLAGLTYVSGAVADFVAGLAFVAIGMLARSQDLRRFRLAGACLLVIGVILTPVQLLAAAQSTSGTIPWALPWEPAFWAYGLGLIGGSLWLGPAAPTTADLVSSAGIAVVGSVAAGVAALGALRSLRRAGADVVHTRGAVVLLTLTPVVLVYMGMVAVSRTQFHAPSDPSLLDYYALGVIGHHPFWISLLWPWAAVMLVLLASTPRLPKLARWRGVGVGSLAVVICAGALLVSSVAAGSYNYNAVFARVSQTRTAELDCLEGALNEGKRMTCEPVFPAWDLTDSVLTAMANDTSFTRYLRLLPTPVGGAPAGAVPASAAPLYAFSSAGLPSVRLTNATDPVATADGMRFQAQNTAFVEVHSGRVSELRACELLEVTLSVRTQTSAVMHVFWSSAAGTAPAHFSSFGLTEGGAVSTQVFELIDTSGFADSVRLRLVLTPQPVELLGFEYRCRMSR